MFKHVTNNNSHRFMDDDYDTFSAVCVICSSLNLTLYTRYMFWYVNVLFCDFR